MLKMQYGANAITVVCGAIVIAAVLVGVALQLWGAQQWRRQFEAALAGNQPEVAQTLIRARWLNTTTGGLAIAGAGLGLLAAMAFRPAASVFVLPAAVLLGVGLPVAVYGHLSLRAERPAPTSRVVAPIVLSVLLAAGVAAAALTIGRSFGPTLQASLAFNRMVERATGAPVGTVDVTLDGHNAKGCLTGGGAWGMQSCGGYHKGIRFSTPRPGFLNVYYVPDTDEYHVFGRARVDPGGKTVENGRISVAEILGSSAPPDVVR
jgi:hypothetical protein